MSEMVYRQQGSFPNHSGDTFTIADGAGWYPGIYDSVETAKHALTMNVELVQRISARVCSHRRENRPITMDDLKAGYAACDLMAGVYRHYTGHLYQVTSFANDANHEGRVVVVYTGLDLSGAKSVLRTHVRTAEDFFAAVDAKTGVALQGYWNGEGDAPVHRFTYVGPTAPADDLAERPAAAS